MTEATQQRSLYPWLMKDYLALASDFLTGRLHHALLIYGAQGLGIEQLGQRLVELIHCNSPNGNKACGNCQQCLLHESQSHADFYHVACLENKAQISIDQIRQLSKKIQDTGLVSTKRIVVIQSIELMTESASNALLKMLEEPPMGVYFLLISANVKNVAPTIKSRCFKVLISTPDLNKTIGWLNKKAQVDINVSQLSLLGNTPLQALAAINNDFLPYLTRYTQALNNLYHSWANQQLNESFCHSIDVIETFTDIEKSKTLNINIETLIAITQRFNQYVVKQQLVGNGQAQNEPLLTKQLQEVLAYLPTEQLIEFSDRLVSLNRILSQNNGVNISNQLGRYINDITTKIATNKE